MKIEVKLYVAGKVFSEIVEAANYADGKETALAPTKIPRSSLIFCIWVIALSKEPSDKSAPVHVFVWLPSPTVGCESLKKATPSPIAREPAPKPIL